MKKAVRKSKSWVSINEQRKKIHYLYDSDMMAYVGEETEEKKH